MFAKIDQIFTLNFYTGQVQLMYKFETKFSMQPVFFKANDE